MLRKLILAVALSLSAFASAARAQEGAADLATFQGDGAPAVIRRQPGNAWEQHWAAGPDNGGLRLLSARSITGSLTRQGYRNVDIKRLRGANYIAEAESPRGNRVLLVVDGRTSEITGRQVIEWEHPKRDWDDGGWWRSSPWSGPRW